MGISVNGVGGKGGISYAEKTLHLVGGVGAHTLDVFHIQGVVLLRNLHYVVHDVTDSTTCSGCGFSITDGVATLSMHQGASNDLSLGTADDTYTWRNPENAMEARTTWSAGNGDILLGECRYTENGPDVIINCTNAGHITYTYTADAATDLYITVRIFYEAASSGATITAV